MIPSEFARRKIKKKKKYINKMIPVLVLRIINNNIDVSKRKVNDDEKKLAMKRYKENIWSLGVIKTLVKRLKDKYNEDYNEELLYKKIIYKIRRNNKNLKEGFKQLNDIELDDNIKRELIDIVKINKLKKIILVIDLRCYDINGVDIVRECLIKSIKGIKDIKTIVNPPKYTIIGINIEEKINECINRIKNNIKLYKNIKFTYNINK